MQFTDDEIETIKELILDCGNDCPSVNWDKRQALGEKLGVLEPEKPPTEEELARRKAFQESPLGIQVQEMFKRTNEYMVKSFLEQQDTFKLMTGENWSDSEAKMLKIRFPKDFKG
jgi:hypothetical protein